MIEQYKLDLQTNINNLTSKHDTEVANINALITALQNADTASEARIAELEAKVSGLLTTYTVSFDTNGGNEIIAPQSVKRGEKVAKPADPTREGYTFLGWYVGDEKWSFIGYSVTESITITAKWVSSKILAVSDNCTLNDNTLTILVKYPSDYVDIKSKITYDENCSISLYKNSNLTSEYSHCRMTDIAVGENKAYLLIEYDENEYTIYDVVVYGITAVDFTSEGDVFKTVYVNEDLTVNAPEEIPTSRHPGYEFSHWTVNGELVEFPYTVSVDTVFEAAYTPIVYTITYNVNDGIMPESYITEYTVESGATLPIPTRSLYLFDGWYESATFDNEAIDSISVGEYGNKTYYAQWKSATNGVTYFLSPDGTYYTVTGYEGTSTEIIIPDTLEGVPVTTIASGAFKGKQRIRSITIPDSVTDIGNEAFSGCISLTTLNLGNRIKYIPAYMVYACQKLTSINIPNSVTSIGEGAFAYCTSLTSVTIPNSVTSIGDRAFACCSSLTSVTIGNSVTSIEAYAFAGCSSLTSITIPDSVTSIGHYAFEDCSSLTSVTIGNSVTSIGGNAFEYCSSLTSITIPNSVTSIGSYAFWYCSSLTSITIPDSVTSIEFFAFAGCSSLTSITIPNSVTSIEDYAFSGCSSLYIVYNNSSLFLEVGSENNGYVACYAKILVDNGVTTYAEDGYEYLLTDEGFLFDYDGTTYRLRAYGGNELAVTLPNDINGNSYQIYDMQGVVNVIIPDSVTEIGKYAFYSCNSLTSVIIPSSVTEIGYGAFYDCDSLTIYTEWLSKPNGWDSGWNDSDRPVVWGYEG